MSLPEVPEDQWVECKHCTDRIQETEWGWVHAEGHQRGMHRCALRNYGYDAAPVGDECSFACRGYEKPPYA